MAPPRTLYMLRTLTVLLLLSVDAMLMPAFAVQDDFYQTSCPDAESVIANTVNAEIDKNFKIAAGLIRMAFHDCFVEGCDGSVLLEGEDTERTAEINLTLLGFEAIDAAETAVEAVCPGVVSCADIIAYAARDSTVKLNGTGWVVQGGRKDGNVSSAAAAQNDLPLPTFDASQLIDAFAQRNLSTQQMVVLSGAHTVGVGHCNKFVERLYNFSPTNDTDPTLNATLANQLKLECPSLTFNETIEIFMETITPGQFDSNYYVDLTRQNGLFTSDQTLFEDSRTQQLVESLISEQLFDSEFGEAMRALGTVGVKTEGQVRTICSQVNA
ncbi:peroxidase [Marchantia polymorpha subsp. ruderalis]|uniref:Peroxidase n=2 Tax=Marchantia polymorpha TaxID=3197 RepID=A0AAF6B7S7_MARPO|nr:hypothetical protein MARPO_0157s0026 [Marchantia polymorpha]BBN08061.1 hypothetical protein Mp_4g08520 [Marchantia polymorpha subsp. ruderalis]|eukprot:PTQ28694.1 hypothetical protein MARPO_0157s0026 [Marchantia polymorpha]